MEPSAFAFSGGNLLGRCGSLIALAATGAIIVATCVAMVVLALKHRFFRHWPIQFSVAGYTPPSRWVSRIGFGFASVFMALGAPGVATAFVGTSTDGLCDTYCTWMYLWFATLGLMTAFAVLVQGVFALFGTQGSLTRKVHIAAVKLMWVSMQLLWCSAAEVLFMGYLRNVTVVVSAWRPLLVLLVPYVPFATCLFFLRRRGPGSYGAILQWSFVAMYVGLFEVLAAEILYFSDAEMQCDAEPGFLWVLLGLFLFTFTIAVITGCATTTPQAGALEINDPQDQAGGRQRLLSWHALRETFDDLADDPFPTLVAPWSSPVHSTCVPLIPGPDNRVESAPAKLSLYRPQN